MNFCAPAPTCPVGAVICDSNNHSIGVISGDEKMHLVDGRPELIYAGNNEYGQSWIFAQYTLKSITSQLSRLNNFIHLIYT